MCLPTRKDRANLLIVFLGMCLSSAVWADATIIKGIRTGSDQAYVRVVIETNAPLDPRPTISVNRNTLRISLAGVEKDPSTLKSEAYRDDVVKIDVTSASKETRIEAILAFIPTSVRTFFLIGPHRFVIDAYRPPATATAEPSTEELQPISIIEENGIRPDEVNEQATSPQKGQPSVPGEGFGAATSQAHNPDGSNHKRFQRRLLVILIVVTSIILVVIIFLMCMDKQRK
jgi:hypothetical protein